MAVKRELNVKFFYLVHCQPNYEQRFHKSYTAKLQSVDYAGGG